MTEHESTPVAPGAEPPADDAAQSLRDGILSPASRTPPGTGRRVVQLTDAMTFAMAGQVIQRTMALCDDGTMWELQQGALSAVGARWRRLPDVPASG